MLRRNSRIKTRTSEKEETEGTDCPFSRVEELKNQVSKKNLLKPRSDKKLEVAQKTAKSR